MKLKELLKTYKSMNVFRHKETVVLYFIDLTKYPEVLLLEELEELECIDGDTHKHAP